MKRFGATRRHDNKRLKDQQGPAAYRGNSVRWVTFLIFLRGGQILSSPSALVLGRGWPQPLARRHSLRSPKILLVAPANLKRTVSRKHFPQGVFTRWQTTSSKATLLPEPGPGHAPAL